ncbi:MAG: hypothetical protein AB1714_04795 [Acidobacteriota bacterium]
MHVAYILFQNGSAVKVSVCCPSRLASRASPKYNPFTTVRNTDADAVCLRGAEVAVNKGALPSPGSRLRDAVRHFAEDRMVAEKGERG